MSFKAELTNNGPITEIKKKNVPIVLSPKGIIIK
jgi:hypothetical protein